ncbi:FAD-dependent oxidoreductase [Escherichia coli]
MSEDKFDAIVVGAGVAGSVAALVMARAGLDVLVIERGDSAGCKNMTGGRLYAQTLEEVSRLCSISAGRNPQGHTRENLLLNRRKRRYPRFSPRATRCSATRILAPICVIVWTRG